MCETSNTPAALRTASCSARTPSGYWTGISQPPNETSFALAATWASKSGVRFSVGVVTRTRLAERIGRARAIARRAAAYSSVMPSPGANRPPPAAAAGWYPDPE